MRRAAPVVACTGRRAGRRSGVASCDTGRCTTNSLPWPSPALRASTWPPCIPTRLRTTVSPMPSPPRARSSDASPCAKRSKTKGRKSAAMPIPVSRTRIATPSPSRSAVSQMEPPRGVYLAALLSRLPTTCASRAGSASRRTGSPGSETVKAWPRASMLARTISTACSTTVDSRTSSLRSVIFPCVMRDTSSRSSTSRARCRTCRSAIWTTWVRSAPSRWRR